MKKAYLLLIFSIVILGTKGVEFYVSSDEGIDEPTCGSPTNQCQSIGYVIRELIVANLTANTQEIIVAPGVYNGSANTNLFVTQKNFIMRSTSGAASTIIDGGRINRGFVLNQCNITLVGFTIRYCLGTQTPVPSGAAFYIDNAFMEMEDCVVEWNNSPGDSSSTGAAFFIRSGSPLVRRTIIQHNIAGAGGGVYTGTTSAPVFTDCWFYNNTVYSGGWSGALLPEEASEPVFINCTFERNSATFGGAIDDGAVSKSKYYDCKFIHNFGSYGAAYYGFGNSEAYFKGCYFAWNIAFNSGGAIRTSSAVKPVFEDCIFEYNEAKSASVMGLYGLSNTTSINCIYRNHVGQAGNGGVVASVGAEGNWINCLFQNNSGVEGGAGAHALGAPMKFINCTFEKCDAFRGGAIEIIGSDETVFIINSTFIDSSGVNGGAIAAVGDAKIVVENCNFIGSRVLQRGGAIFVEERGDVSLTNFQISGSEADSGSAIFVGGDGIVTLTNGIIRRNTARTDGAGMWIGTNSRAFLQNVEFSENVANFGSAVAINAGAVCSSFSFNNTLLINNTARRSGAVSFLSSTVDCEDYCSDCTFSDNKGLWGSDFSSRFDRMIEASGRTSLSLTAGETFTISFIMKDFFNQSMAGELNTQVFISPGPGLSVIGVSTQEVKDNGIATFESIALGGLPGSNYFITFYTIPASPNVTIPIVIIPCDEGFTGLSSREDGADFICLEIDSINSSAITAVSVITGILILATIGLMFMLWWKRAEPVIKRAQVFFCETVAGGALLCYISVYTWMDTEGSMCTARSWLLSIGLCAILGSLILKEYKIYALFRAAANLRTKVISDRTLILGTAGFVSVDVLLLILWSTIDPPVNTPIVTLATKEIRYICSSGNSEVFLWLILGYKFLLLLCGAIIAFLTRNIPESYNESKYIAFSIYNFLIALVVIPSLLYVVEAQTLSFVIISFGIIVFVSITLQMLFLPKLYYSLNKQAVIRKMDKQISSKEKEISLLKRQRRMEIEALSLQKDFELTPSAKESHVASLELSRD